MREQINLMIISVLMFVAYAFYGIFDMWWGIQTGKYKIQYVSTTLIWKITRSYTFTLMIINFYFILSVIIVFYLLYLVVRKV